MDIIDTPWYAAPRTYLPPPERVEAVKTALKQQGITDEKDTTYFLQTLVDCGLFWEPWPPPKTTAREIRRQAKSEPSKPKRKMIEEAERVQTIRGSVIIPVGLHDRRRPEREANRAIQLMDYHLRERTPKNAKERRQCLAAVLLAASGAASDGTSESMVERVRKRLERVNERERVQESDYKIACWCAERLQNPAAPFPIPMGVQMILSPMETGHVTWEMLPSGMSLDTFQPIAEAVVATLRRLVTTWPPPVPVFVDMEVKASANDRFVVRLRCWSRTITELEVGPDGEGKAEAKGLTP